MGFGCCGSHCHDAGIGRRERRESRYRGQDSRKNAEVAGQGLFLPGSDLSNEKRTNPMKRQTSLIAALTLCSVPFLWLFASTVTAHSLSVARNLDLQIDLVPSASHTFRYVRAFRDGDELVLYGKLDHAHPSGGREGHVDLIFLNAAGEKIDSANLPIVNRGNHRKGWSGAHFRVRLDRSLDQAKAVRITLHEPASPRELAEPCGNAGGRDP
jgi:hypothetical protein